jgi:hypothetical protein
MLVYCSVGSMFFESIKIHSITAEDDFPTGSAFVNPFVWKTIVQS